MERATSQGGAGVLELASPLYKESNERENMDLLRTGSGHHTRLSLCLSSL